MMMQAMVVVTFNDTNKNNASNSIGKKQTIPMLMQVMTAFMLMTLMRIMRAMVLETRITFNRQYFNSLTIVIIIMIIIVKI